MVKIFLSYIFYSDKTYNYMPFISEEYAIQYIEEKLKQNKKEDVLFYKIIESDLRDEIQRM
jgi:hypothetical protein